MIFLKLFSYGFQNSFQCYLQHFKSIESIPYQLDPVESSEHLVIQNIMSTIIKDQYIVDINISYLEISQEIF